MGINSIQYLPEQEQKQRELKELHYKQRLEGNLEGYLEKVKNSSRFALYTEGANVAILLTSKISALGTNSENKSVLIISSWIFLKNSPSRGVKSLLNDKNFKEKISEELQKKRELIKKYFEEKGIFKGKENLL